MSVFEKLVNLLSDWEVNHTDLRLEIDRPVRVDGVYGVTLFFDDGYSIEIGWSRYRGFGLRAGYEFILGDGFDEVFAEAVPLFERIRDLVAAREKSSVDAELEIADLRRIVGMLQIELARNVGMSKGGLAQLEKAGTIANMKMETVEKIISGLGGELVVNVRFPSGLHRRLKTGVQRQLA